ncbi:MULTISPECIES: GNAT family N-acetyltransferase [unclassified Staphylococcus]|uniref:GNAT family N-acetyltransferase n=1 Tax=unclassified Staphylococcus TaxID=91994 RepID=UPI0021D02248|nr:MULTISPECIES: GNAT family N-acetyltransferase [unclassified Staphylococcus]UXR69934.1 GNAT family N-acetyltransferase [Staphylococcus sp. IVB6246]UXR71973.1 GNAT family N-acetyltransferase [Staphylococcus sp. IVB6240]UXR74281.1 GNAT family N-acetyltransferase [Staphylococcus sp. IVB6238]UXR76668.1 GNAT family N-acetyltransferase [Staphylococcus sp. IVB6233]UXR80797.1 GNAT family N-acetyltransferase [Staphylococcus sp. IVB6218]
MTVYIETARLRLRSWETSDLERLQQLNANRQARQFFPSILSYQRTEKLFNSIRSYLNTHHIGLFAVEFKATKEWIGMVGLNYLTEKQDYPFSNLPFYEIGWRLLPDVWDNGIATEAAEAVLRYAKNQGIKEVYAIAAEQNEASIRVMEKIGMQRYDKFEFRQLGLQHPLKRQVRYRIDLIRENEIQEKTENQ